MRNIAAPALEVLGRDFRFPHKLDGVPGSLSDFGDLKIGFFVTNDGVKLSYWEAGEGEPLVFIPGWSASGARYINVMYLLAKHYRVIVLDPRNQGLSQRVDYGTRIARLSMDLKELISHLGLVTAVYCGWSMGAAILWGYIDLFGTRGIRKVAFVDEPISIYAHADWSEQQRREAGAMTTSAEQLAANLTAIANDSLLDPRSGQDSPYFVNSESFAAAFVTNDPGTVGLVLYDHLVNDWRDVVRHKIDVPTAVFSGEQSSNLPSQRWLASVIEDATLYSYSSSEHGDHFLMFKNPLRFTRDLRSFLER